MNMAAEEHVKGKRKWNIRTRILLTLTGLIFGILLIVAAAFNLSIRQYIRSRLFAQLNEVSQDASRQLEDDPHGFNGGGHFNGHPDREMGTSGSVVILNEDGSVFRIFHGDEQTSSDLSEYFMARGQVSSIKYKVVATESASYALSVTDDPVEAGKYLLTYVDVTSLISLTGRINLMLAAVILAALIISVFLSRSFAGSLSEPVQALSAFAREIGTGDLRQQAFSFRDVEFDDLAGSMNYMVSELNAARQKQETFFQNVSHELRTPLTSIRGNAEGIVYGVMEPQPAAKVILAESDKLGSMVEDILYLSRLSKAAPEAAGKALDLREVISLCVSEQRLAAEEKGIAFCFDFDEEPVPALIREQDAMRLFSNLISNAIRYAKEKISLICKAENGEVFVSVADDGPGIAEEDLPHIFERFYKGKGGRHGIGLAIAEAAAKSAQGTLAAYNKDGAVFEVRFPAAE